MSDLISRQDAIDALAEQMPRSYTPDGSHPADEVIFMAQEIYADCIATIEILPSAQKKGEWIPHEGGKFVGFPYMHYECSECRGFEPTESNFCPNCGADMRKEVE